MSDVWQAVRMGTAAKFVQMFGSLCGTRAAICKSVIICSQQTHGSNPLCAKLHGSMSKVCASLWRGRMWPHHQLVTPSGMIGTTGICALVVHARHQVHKGEDTCTGSSCCSIAVTSKTCPANQRAQALAYRADILSFHLNHDQICSEACAHPMCTITLHTLECWIDAKGASYMLIQEHEHRMWLYLVIDRGRPCPHGLRYQQV
jgi:hypothetical protein